MTNGKRQIKVAVIGGGVTGLAAAQQLLKHDHVHVTMFEAGGQCGGMLQTKRENGFLIETGPDSFITNKPAAIQLCDEIGFSDQLIPTDATFRRSLVLHNGRPQPVPAGFTLMAPANLQAIRETSILSEAGKDRLLEEQRVPTKPVLEDESLASFVCRRFGKEAFDKLVQPLVGGIYTADPEKLSLLATLPRFLQQEQSHGSVIAATLADAKTKQQQTESGARYGLFATPENGLQSLGEHLQAWLLKHANFQLHLNCGVRELTTANGWCVEDETGNKHVFDAVVCGMPLHRTANLLPGDRFKNLKQALTAIEYASSAIVVSTHRLTDFQHPMDAFGMVVPAIEKRRILAVSFSSRKFSHRAPEGQILLRTFVGGATQAELLDHSDDQIAAIVREELTDIFGMSQAPMSEQVCRWNNAMPQYHLGHQDRVAAIESAVSGFAGLKLAGGAFYGVGIPDSIASGQKAAEELLAGFAD